MKPISKLINGLRNYWEFVGKATELGHDSPAFAKWVTLREMRQSGLGEAADEYEQQLDLHLGALQSALGRSNPLPLEVKAYLAVLNMDHGLDPKQTLLNALERRRRAHPSWPELKLEVYLPSPDELANVQKKLEALGHAQTETARGEDR